MISQRAKKLTANPSAIMVGHIACGKNPFGPSNPDGYLNFGIAENRLIDELAVEVLSRETPYTHKHIHYAPLQGLDSLRSSFASFCAKFLNVSEITADKVVVQSGLSSVCESMAFALFDEGDELIVPAPYYTGFRFDFEGRFGVKLVEAQMENFEHAIGAIEAAITPKTKGVLLTSPHNPTGKKLSEDFLKAVADLCETKNLHLISDEIYALSILDCSPHKSILSVNKTYKNIHVLYGMAKDFGLAGIKTGFYYTRNEECLKAMAAATYFHPVSSHTQELVANFMSDHNAIEAFTKEANARVSKALAKLRSILPELKITMPEAGMFLMADFRDLLAKFPSENDLFLHFLNELKINMTPGLEMGLAQPGFFRVCYARPENELEEFAIRLKKLIP